MPGKSSPARDTVDPVLFDLERAEAEYREREAEWQRQMEDLRRELKEAGFRVQAAQDDHVRLQEEIEAARQLAAQERERAERERQRVREREHLLADIHRALFGGNVHELILRACLTLTGATRGLYLTVPKGSRTPLVRAAVDVDGYPGAQPSAFIKAVTRKALDSEQTLVCNDKADLVDFPRPGRGAERFHNLIAAPVVTLKHLSGVIVVGDRKHGEFGDEDVEAILAVGNGASVALENNRLREEVQAAYLATVATLADAIEAKDPYTHGHCEMASAYAALIAEELNLPAPERTVICYAALLHDAGKIGVSDGILNKPGPLLDEERALVRSHVKVGHDLICHVPALTPVAEVVLRHHEWFDGNGYPDGLKGDDIPIGARVVAAVDAYSAMITRRSYKPAYSEEYAREELRRCAGTQFDPAVVKALLKVLDFPEKRLKEAAEEVACGLLPGFDRRHEARG